MSDLYERRGGEALANTATAGDQDGAEIAYLSDGRFVIVWRDGSAQRRRYLGNCDPRPDLQCGRQPVGHRVPRQHGDGRRPDRADRRRAGRRRFRRRLDRRAAASATAAARASRRRSSTPPERRPAASSSPTPAPRSASTRPSMAASADGGFVLTWIDAAQQRATTSRPSASTPPAPRSAPSCSSTRRRPGWQFAPPSRCWPTAISS